MTSLTREQEKQIKAEVDAFLTRTSACRPKGDLTVLELYHAARLGFKLGMEKAQKGAAVCPA